MKKIVITGGAGFIGSHMVEALEAQNNYHITVLDNLSSGSLQHIQPYLSDNLCFVEADILDKEALLKTFTGVHTVFHLAAKISASESISDPTGYTTTNTIGTLNVIDAAKQSHVNNLVIASSAAIYGNQPQTPKTESMAPDPQSPYAVSKLDAEYYAAIYRQVGKLNIACLRYFNVFGPRQNLNSAYAAAVPIFIKQALNSEPLTIFGTGEQTRDFIYVEDIVQANLLAAGANGTFNVGCATPTSIQQLAKKIIDISQSKSKIIYAENRPGDVLHSYAHCEKIHSEFNFKATWTLDAGLAELIKLQPRDQYE